METLTYLHLALAYEATTDTTVVYSLDSLKLFEWFKKLHLATHTRIYLLSLVAILGILGMAGEALAQSTLNLGDRNSQVTLIQERLQQLGYLKQPVDGVFGSATQKAVIQFQRDYGLNPDGIVGQATESALLAEFAPRREILTQGFSSLSRPDTLIQRGDRNSEVTALQRRLRELKYFNGQLTGYFGSATEEAVTRFQVDNDINPNGIVDDRTQSALFGGVASENVQSDLLSLPPPPPISRNFSAPRFNQLPSTGVLQLNSCTPAVRQLQQALREKGFNPGPIDGCYGFQTQEAVRQFQRTRDLSVDGVAGRETLAALGLLPDTPTNSYVVVVPILNQNTIKEVQRFIPGADARDSKRGQYVNAGEFPTRNAAESLSYLLRSQGLDARVAYSP